MTSRGSDGPAFAALFLAAVSLRAEHLWGFRDLTAAALMAARVVPAGVGYEEAGGTPGWIQGRGCVEGDQLAFPVQTRR